MQALKRIPSLDLLPGGAQANFKDRVPWFRGRRAGFKDRRAGFGDRGACFGDRGAGFGDGGMVSGTAFIQSALVCISLY